LLHHLPHLVLKCRYTVAPGLALIDANEADVTIVGHGDGDGDDGSQTQRRSEFRTGFVSRQILWSPPLCPRPRPRKRTFCARTCTLALTRLRSRSRSRAQAQAHPHPHTHIHTHTPTRHAHAHHIGATHSTVVGMRRSWVLKLVLYWGVWFCTLLP
jgi:hypothetical protein